MGDDGIQSRVLADCMQAGPSWPSTHAAPPTATATPRTYAVGGLKGHLPLARLSLLNRLDSQEAWHNIVHDNGG